MQRNEYLGDSKSAHHLEDPFSVGESSTNNIAMGHLRSPSNRSSHLRPVSPNSFEYVAEPTTYAPPPGSPPRNHPAGLYDDQRTSKAPDSPYSDDDLNDTYAPRSSRYEPQASLVQNANDIERGDDGVNLKDNPKFDYQDPYNSRSTVMDAAPSPPLANVQKKQSPFQKLFGNNELRYPLEQRIENKKRGIGRQTYPFVVWALSAAMVGVLIYELVYNARQQGNPFSFKPSINPMLGPSSVGLITLGARWPACMRIVPDIPLTLSLGCPNNTANPPTSICSIEQLCAFGGFHDKTPNQWWRFITPVFLHAGLVHLLLNMLAQLTLSAQVEREMGSGAFIILYMAAGIFGNVFGGNFALVGLPSVGASGAIFGTVAVMWVDLFAHWQLEVHPGRKLAFLIVDLVVGVALGYVPGVDNFAHLGGFLMGILCAAILYPVISTTKRHKAIMWAFRIAMIPVAVVLFVVLIRNFYTNDPFAACAWCRYLSCIPTSANNRCKGTGLTITN